MSKPNVLFILADDERFDTIHALGNDQIQTPNLDRLAAMGTSFTHAHIPGGTSGAVCMPSRAMINSGKTLFHLYGAGEQIPQSHVTMGECFRKNGYHTIGIGKWHNGVESFARSFSDGDNIFFGGMWDHWNVPVNSYHPDGKYENHINYVPDFQHCNHPMDMIAERISAGVHSTDLFTDCAVDFLNRRKGEEQPFFLYMALLAPHDPRTMPERFRKMYDPDQIRLPENFRDNHPFDIGINPKTGEDRDENLAAYPRTESEIRRHIADYYGMISHIDYNIGKLLEALEKNGQLENTIIVYTGDNGLAVGQHGLMGKQSLYDHSVRVPLMIAGKGVKENARTSDYVYLLDIYPTLCEMCGIRIPESVEGKSFLPALKGEKCNNREDLYFAYTHLIRAVKDRRYKLLEYKLHPEETQLFDLEQDPLELNNLANHPDYQGIRARLKARMLEYRAEWEDNSENQYTDLYWE